MKRHLLFLACCSGFVLSLQAAEDPGRTRLADVQVCVIHATNGEPVAGAEVPAETLERLRSEKRLKFARYRLLGTDRKALLRSYESWAEPLKPSDELLVRFEAQGRPSHDSAILDLELWMSKRKIMKTDARLEGDRALFTLGPEWRGGRLIIAIRLVQPESEKSSSKS